MNFNTEILIFDALNNIKYEFVKNLTNLFKISNFYTRNKLFDLFIRYIFDNTIGGKFDIDKFKISYNDIYYFTQTNKTFLPTREDIFELEDFLISKFKSLLTYTNKKYKNRIKTYTITKIINDETSITYEIFPGIFGVRMFKFTPERFNDIEKKYIGDKYLFDNYMSLLILRYSVLGTENQHLSFPPQLVLKFNINVELFGSPFNTTSNNFCSPFFDIEKYFGSVGNFFDYELKSDKNYTFNPPYIEEFMNEATKKLLHQLDCIKNYFIIVNIPVWDSESQKKYKFKDNNLKFEAYSLLKNSSHFHSETICYKEIHKYYNYFTNSFISVSNTHTMILTDRKIDFNADNIRDMWKDVLKNEKC